MFISKHPSGIPAQALKDMLSAWATRSNRYPWFTGTSKDLPEWFAIVEEACEENLISDTQWTDAGIYFISGDLQPVMEERKLKYLEESGEAVWRWGDFKDDIRRVVVEAEKIIEAEKNNMSHFENAKDAAGQFRKDHPYIIASASAGLVVGGSLIFIPALGLVALNAIGFAIAGVATSSIASIFRQGVLFGGATTGALCVLQSIGNNADPPSTEPPAPSDPPTDPPAPTDPPTEDPGEISLSASGTNVEVPSSKRAKGLDEPPPYEGGASNNAGATPSRAIPVQYAVFTSKRRARPMTQVAA